MTPLDLWQHLSETSLPKLWLPKRENVYPVDTLPTLGTGKLDLAGVKAKAQQLVAACAVNS
jgi:acyl-[acyl-carrier-protein]-phospholipid O-acyltransferase/long-chain-fatty-acid--[acyl-carrier-protein] ligase